MYQLIIVDDEYEIRNGISNYFPWNSIKFEVSGLFKNGQLAYDYIQNNHVDVLLTDIRMPIMDGLELIDKVNQANKNIYSVILSGHKDFEYAKQGIRLGVKDYIVKPTKYAQLHEIFSRIAGELDQLMVQDETDNTTDTELITQIKNYIKKNYATATLESTASYVNLNPYYLSNLFSQQTSEKFYDYVLNIKIQKAVQMLTQTEKRIYDISEEIGYSNPNSFTYAFKQYFGITPRAYRRLHKK